MVEEFINILAMLMTFILVVFLVCGLFAYDESEELSDYEIVQVDSIREYSGSYGKKMLRIEYDGKEKSFNHIDVYIGESTHLRKYNNKLISLRLYLSPDDYEKFVGQYESLSVLEGE